jgi:hypothetical protein
MYWCNCNWPVGEPIHNLAIRMQLTAALLRCRDEALTALAVDGGTEIDGEGFSANRRPERKPRAAAGTPDGLGVDSPRSGA